MFHDPPHRFARLRHRQALLEGFNRHYRLFRETSAQAKRRFEQADWHGQQRAQRERIEFYDKRVDEAAERLQTEFQAGSLEMDVWQQVIVLLHRPAHQPPPARARRDLLQLGDDEDPAPQLLQQRLHLRAPGGLDRVHRERRAGLAADLPRLLPDQRTLRETLLRVIDNFQLAREFEDLGARRRPRARRRAVAPRRVPHARQLPAAGAVFALLSQQERVRGRQDHQRLQRDAVRAADPAHAGRQAHH